jgi:hypothetical protein
MAAHSKSAACLKWKVAMLFAMAAVAVIPCRAQGFPPLSADHLKMTGDAKAPGAPAIILFREVDRDDASLGRVHEDSYYRVKILTEEGRKFGNIEIPFIKNVDEVTHIQARTIRPDGVYRALPQDPHQTTP